MEPAHEHRTNDEFGYQRFALTEAAYDLVNSLIGVYAGLRFTERQKASPNLALIEQYRQRIQQLRAAYQQEDWSDLVALETLINRLATEYKTHHTEAASHSINATDRRPETIQTH